MFSALSCRLGENGNYIRWYVCGIVMEIITPYRLPCAVPGFAGEMFFRVVHILPFVTTLSWPFSGYVYIMAGSLGGRIIGIS